MLLTQMECEFTVAALHSPKLTAERAEAEGIKETAATNLAGVGNSFARPRLRPLIEKDNLGAVDDIGLNGGDVNVFLNLVHPNHIMVRRPPYLNNVMVSVVNEAIGAESIPHTIQAEHVAFTLTGISMKLARSEVVGLEHWTQPWRTQIDTILVHCNHRTDHRDLLLLGLDNPNVGLLIIDSQFVQLSCLKAR